MSDDTAPTTPTSTSTLRVPTGWIHSPLVDHVFMSWGWLVGLVAFVVVKQQVGLKESAVILAILAINFLHRHITFPLVYGDPVVVSEREKSYFGLPVLLLIITAISVNVHSAPDVVVDGKHLVDGAVELHVDAKFEGQRVSCRNAFNGDIDNGGRIAPEWLLCPSPIVVSKADSGMRFGLALGADKSWVRVRVVDKATGKELHRASKWSSRPLFLLLAALSVLWTIWHTLMQKMGLLRVYASISKTGTPWGDRVFVFSWFLAVLFSLLARDDVRAVAVARSSFARVVDGIVAPLSPLMWTLSAVAFVVALSSTWTFIKDVQARGRVAWPRLSFALSLLVLYGVLCVDLVIGYAMLGLSHSLEYLAFVVVFSKKKYARVDDDSVPMVRWTRRPWRSLAVFVVVFWGAFFAARWASSSWLHVYIVGSSFLHFLFDGWIWKVKRPAVHAPLSGDS